MSTGIAIGVDVGGSGVKCGAVDIATGQLVGARRRGGPPPPSAPGAVGGARSRPPARAAPAAGRVGGGVGQAGTVFVLTLGTGLGSALFINGVLVPDTELGHMEIRGRDGGRASAAGPRAS